MTSSSMTTIRAAGGILAAGSGLVIVSALLHPFVPHNAEGIATVAPAVWANFHLASGLGYALAGLAALLLLAERQRGAAARVGLATMVFAGGALLVGTGIDGASAQTAAASLSGGDGGVHATFTWLGRHVYTMGYGGAGLGGALLLASRARAAAGAWRAGFAVGAVGFVAFALAGIVTVGLGAPLSFLFAGGLAGYAALAAHGLHLAWLAAAAGAEPFPAMA